MDPDEMERLFRTHREAEARRDLDAVIQTFTPDCYLETIPLGVRAEGRDAVRAAYVGYYTAFPDLTPDDEAAAFGEDAMVAWDFCGGRAEASGWAYRLVEDRLRCHSPTSRASRTD